MTSRLARRRRAAGYTQKTFAEAVGVSRATVNNWENGRVQPHPEAARKIADLLGVEDAYKLLPARKKKAAK